MGEADALTYYENCPTCDLIKARVPGTGCFIHDYVVHMADHTMRKANILKSYELGLITEKDLVEIVQSK